MGPLTPRVANRSHPTTPGDAMDLMTVNGLRTEGVPALPVPCDPDALRAKLRRCNGIHLDAVTLTVDECRELLEAMDERLVAEKLQEEIEELEHELKIAKSERDDLQDEIDDMDDADELNKEIDALEAENDELHARVEQLERQLDDLLTRPKG